MSLEDMQNKYTIAFLKKNLKEYKIGSRIIFEILESDSIENYADVSAFINEMKKFGCKVAIDDFGVGYSNFSHLMNLNVDFIKIDVEGMEYEVLKGGKETIKKLRPLLFLETNPYFETARQKPLSSMIFELLSEWEYKIIDPLTQSVLSSIPKDRNDIIACPSEKMDVLANKNQSALN